MMIQKLTFLRRLVGGLLVALVAFIGFSAQAEPPFVATSAMVIDWDENPAENANDGEQIGDLNSLIDGAATQDADDFCYTLTSKPANFTFDSDVTDDDVGAPTDRKAGTADTADNDCYSGNQNDIPRVYLSGTPVSYEANKGKIVLTITGHSNGDDDTNTSKANSVTITINVINFDEAAKAVDKIEDIAGREAPIYMEEDDSVSFLVSQLFSDPEGDPVVLKSDNDIGVCAAGTPGAKAAPSVAPFIGDASSDFALGFDSNTSCNYANDDPNGATNPDVVSVSRAGPQFTVTADELEDAGSGVYRVDLYVRVWSGDPSQTSDLATTHLLIKKGANNVPQVAGGATGFEKEVNESTTGPLYWIGVTPPDTGDWNAADLDETGRGGGSESHKDTLTYGIKGPSCDFIHKTLASYNFSGGVCAKASQTGVNLTMVQALFADAEGDSYPATVTVTATDGWDTVEYPITIKLKNVNELIEHDDPKEEDVIPTSLRMTQGEERTLDLDDYFTDPEGDAITYTAFTDIDNKSASVDGSTLTIVGKGAPDEGDTASYTVTVIATDSAEKGAVTHNNDITVNVRHDNVAPAFDAGIISVGMSAREDAKVGAYLSPLVNFTDADSDEDELTASLDSDMFEAVINPKVKNGQKCSTAGKDGCVQTEGKIAIRIAKALNFEEAESHTLNLGMEDDWGGKTANNLIIRVLVDDVNDAPTVVTTTVGEGDDAEEEKVEIGDQTIAVSGSGSMSVGKYFHDEDGDRLLIEASSDMKTVATVTTTGLDMVSYAGVGEGEAKITLIASDPGGLSVSHSFKVVVTENSAPLADADAFAAALPENNTVNVGGFADIVLDGLFSDPDGGDMITSITASSSDEDTLLVVESSDGTMVTLVGRTSGMATLTITAMDRADNSTAQTVEITVNAPPAEAKPIEAFEMDRTTPEVISVAGVFTDSDDGADMLTITAEAVGEGMDRVELAVMDGELTITGVRGVMPGDVEIVLTATDPHGATATSTFTVSVVNVGPTVAMSLEDFEMDRINPETLDVSGVFADADGDMLTVTAEVKDAAIVELSAIDENGSLLVTALAVGSTSVVLTAVDEDGASIMADFEVTVINIEPVVAEAVPDQNTTRADDLTLSISGHFDDPDADNALLTFDVAVANEMFVSATLADDVLTISGLDVGTSAITLTATDADGGMVETTFSAKIENVAPVVANSISPIALEVGGQAASQSISGLFTDDDDSLTYELTSSNAGIASTSLTGTNAMVAPVSRGSATITVTATDPHGASASVTGSVTVGDGELKAVAAKSLAGFGRAMLASVSSSVGSRLMNDARSSDLTLDAWAPVDNHDAMSAMTSEDRSEIAWNTVNTTSDSTTAGMPSTMNAGHMSGVDALRSTFGQSFALNLGSTDNRSNWSVWGDIDRQSYEGAGYDGMASSIYLGADVTVAECWMFGVAVSTNSGESDYTYGTATQTMDMSLTTVLPYVSYQPSHGSSIWGVAGFGSGELETTVVGAANETSDLSTQLTLVGGSQDLTRLGRMNLALRGDAAVATVETDDGNGAADGLGADVNRIRIGLEGSFKSDNSRGGMVEPFGQISLRSDGGDGDTGTGVEVAGGIRMTSSTFTLEAQGRTLAMHGADEYSESGFSLMAKLNPSASATGVSVSIAPRWGADALGNGMLWQDTLNLNSAQTYGALAGFGNAGATKSIDTQIGYGMLVASEQYLLTPFVDLGVSDGDRREMLLGVTLQQMVDASTNLDVNLALGRVEERTGASSGKIGLNATLRF